MTTTDQPTSPSGDSPGGDAAVEHLERLLGEWRGKIDELLVQADLGSKDVAEKVRTEAAAAENAYLAARNRLGGIPKDAGSDLGSLRADVEELIDDLRQAYESAAAAFRRGTAE